MYNFWLYNWPFASADSTNWEQKQYLPQAFRNPQLRMWKYCFQSLVETADVNPVYRKPEDRKDQLYLLKTFCLQVDFNNSNQCCSRINCTSTNFKHLVTSCPDWCGSESWASSSKSEGHRLYSWSGHIPGLYTRSLDGVHVRGNWLMFLSYIDVFLPLYLPSPNLKINK